MAVRQKLFISLCAAVLLVASALISREIGGLMAFIVVWTAGLMWLQGFRVPGFVKRRRKELAEQDGRFGFPNPSSHEVTPTSYQLRIGWFAKLIVYATGIVPLIIGLLAMLAAASPSEARHHLMVGGFWITLFGMAMTRYARVCTRQFVRVDSVGLEAEQFWGVVRMNWDDIVAIAQSSLRMMTQAVLTEHIIFSRDRSIRIPAKLENRDELMATILNNAPAAEF
jgi:hypothetical protein